MAEAYSRSGGVAMGLYRKEGAGSRYFAHPGKNLPAEKTERLEVLVGPAAERGKMSRPCRRKTTAISCVRPRSNLSPGSASIPQPSFRFQYDAYGNTEAIEVFSRWLGVYDNQFTNKGTAFTGEERERLELEGPLPPCVRTLAAVLSAMKIKKELLTRQVYLSYGAGGG